MAQATTQVLRETAKLAYERSVRSLARDDDSVWVDVATAVANVVRTQEVQPLRQQLDQVLAEQ